MKTANLEPTATNYPSPGLLRIFAAMVYDSLLLAAVSLAYGALVVGLRVAIDGQPPQGQRIHWDVFSGSLISLGWFALLVFFYVFFWHRFGQTLGMKTWRLQMVDARSYQNASYQQCLIRSVVALFSLLFFGVGYWYTLFHPQQKTFHDILSGTRLILLSK